MSLRYHYMDNLRAAAMMAGIFFHAALAYSPLLSNVWVTADSSSSVALDAAAWFSHLFRMPLFFVIAGFFSSYLVERRGFIGFLKNRAQRILLPLVLFLPLVWLSFALIIGWAVQSVEHPSPILSFIRAAAQGPEPPPPPPPTTTHLWFLYNLLQFYLVFVALRWAGLLGKGKAAVLTSAKFLVFVLPLLMVPAVALQHAPHPAPEQFAPQLWSFGFFGLFFVVGAQLYERPESIDGLRPYAPWLLVTSVGLYVAYYRLLPGPLSLEDAMSAAGGAPLSARQLLVGGLETFIAVHMTIVCLAGGKALVDRANRVSRFIADSSYWVYIIHLPVLWVLQVYLLDVDWGAWVEFFVSSVGTLIIGLLSYVLLVRWTPIGWLLNGRRRSPTAPAAESTT